MKLLIVGHGPSYRENMDLIRNFDGIRIIVDVSVEDILKEGIRPDYVTWFEISNREDIEYTLKLLPKIKGSILVHRSEECTPVFEECLKQGVQRVSFECPSYVNNVGLFSIIFAQKYLHVKEIHLIGLDHQGPEYPQYYYDAWISEFNKYMCTESEKDCKLIDHSGGSLPV